MYPNERWNSVVEFCSKLIVLKLTRNSFLLSRKYFVAWTRASARTQASTKKREPPHTFQYVNLMGLLFPIVSSIYSWSASFRWLVGRLVDSFNTHDVKQWQWQPPYTLIIYTAEVAISTASYRLGSNTRRTNKKRKKSKREKNTHISLGKQRKKNMNYSGCLCISSEMLNVMSNLFADHNLSWMPNSWPIFFFSGRQRLHLVHYF